MGARPRFHSSLAPGQSLPHAHVYMCSNPVRCNACKQAQLCIFTRVPTRWWGAFLFQVVCVQASHSCIRRLCMSLSAHLSPCVCTSSNPPPNLQSPGEIALRPLAQRLGGDCSRPGLSHPNPASHTLSRLVTSLSEAGPGPVSSPPVCPASSRVSSPCEAPCLTL